MAHVQVSNNITIGILGKYDMCAGIVYTLLHLENTALQGAFAEHQTALQKLSCQKKIVVVLVRTAEDLSACDALIIPGGGETSVILPKLAHIIR
jgi:5'-phosphate synthase pdxT subunit